MKAMNDNYCHVFKRAKRHVVIFLKNNNVGILSVAQPKHTNIRAPCYPLFVKYLWNILKAES
jgi:hypothetical protein